MNRTSMGARFQTTRWTLMDAGGGDSRRDAAWDHFCRSYWYPVYCFIRRHGMAAEDAGDLTQGFFAKLVEQDWLARVERRETRFSTLLVTVLKNHLITQHHRATAEKRGGGVSPVSLDQALAEDSYGREPVELETPESLFEKRWALAVMDAALRRLEEECEATGKGRVFRVLGPFLSREASPGEYEAAGKDLGIHSKSVAVAVHRLRADFRAMVREEVGAGLRDSGLIEEEMRALAAALGA
ncbi:MAG: sigma-70 family RNA polymerase sigma factor [Verrucomicrobiaceae bacterium]|nr:MAG: sigma-70 family RNA polymerase sigma factor [Verrucomicrobiaceae bacterium]